MSDEPPTTIRPSVWIARPFCPSSPAPGAVAVTATPPLPKPGSSLPGAAAATATSSAPASISSPPTLFERRSIIMISFRRDRHVSRFEDPVVRDLRTLREELGLGGRRRLHVVEAGFVLWDVRRAQVSNPEPILEDRVRHFPQTLPEMGEIRLTRAGHVRLEEIDGHNADATAGRVATKCGNPQTFRGATAATRSVASARAPAPCGSERRAWRRSA